MASAAPLPLDDPSDEQLAIAARAGCRASWETLATRHYAPVERSLRRLTGDPEDARDLAQETFLDAHRDLHRLPADRPFAPWLHRIARNNVLPFWRRRGAEQIVSLDPTLEERGDTLPARSRPDPLAACEDGELIGHALAALSPALRQALLLSRAAGYTAAEIGAALGIGQPAAERRLSRAAADFRRRYVAAAGGTRAPTQATKPPSQQR